jgi:hypothetical protein
MKRDTSKENRVETLGYLNVAIAQNYKELSSTNKRINSLIFRFGIPVTVHGI